MYQGIINMIAIIYLFLAGLIPGRKFVSEIDRLVSNDQVDNLPNDCLDDFDILHEKMSLCVWDNRTYDESPNLYINEKELRLSVEAFMNKWGKTLAEIIFNK
jgi:hypothetical protein